MPKKVLCAIDGSRQTERAVGHAVRSAGEAGAKHPAPGHLLPGPAVGDVLRKLHPPVTVT